MTQRKRRIFAVLSAALLLTVATALPVSAVEGYDRGKIAILSDPEQISSFVTYQRDGATLPTEEMTWSVGYGGGRGLRLSDGEGLVLSLYRQLLLNGFTFTAWVNWDGGEAGQRLFTLYRDEENWMTFSPFYQGTALDGGTVNGLYLGVNCGKSGVCRELYHAAGGCYALPSGAWHHVAVTSDGLTLSLYIDGRLLFSEQLLMRLMELTATKMYIGLSPWEGTSFGGVIDDVAIYEKAVDAATIAGWVGLGEPGDPYIPTRPVEQTIDEPDPPAEDLTPAVWGMPRWLFLTLAGVLVVGILAAAVLVAGRGGERR